MEEVGLIVLGSVVGALATGGVQAWDAWRRRKAERRTAARVILGDLYAIEATCEDILKNRHWPNRVDVGPDFERKGETWVEVRTAFAGGVKAFEWVRVDTVYNNLTRTVPANTQMGAGCSANDVASVDALHKLLRPAQEIALRRSASRRQRAKLERELLAR